MYRGSAQFTGAQFTGAQCQRKHGIPRGKGSLGRRALRAVAGRLELATSLVFRTYRCSGVFGAKWLTAVVKRRVSNGCQPASHRNHAETQRLGELRDLGQVAQLVEQRTENPCVGGSIPPLSIRLRRIEQESSRTGEQVKERRKSPHVLLRSPAHLINCSLSPLPTKSEQERVERRESSQIATFLIDARTSARPPAVSYLLSPLPFSISRGNPQPHSAQEDVPSAHFGRTHREPCVQLLVVDRSSPCYLCDRLSPIGMTKPGQFADTCQIQHPPRRAVGGDDL